MTKKCKLARSILLAYLDDELDPPERQAVQQHLQDCPACQHLLSQQEEYLHLLKASQPEPAPEQLADLALMKTRIMAGVKLQKQVKFWHKPAFWLQSTAVLAALLVAVFIIPALLPAAKSPEQMAGEEMALLAEAQKQVDDLKNNADKPSKTSAPAWILYKGSLGELPALACLFADLDQSETVESASDETDESISEETDSFSAACSKLNDAGRSLFGLLEQAEDIRVIVKQEKPDTTIILAAFLPKELTGKLAGLRKSLADRIRSKNIETIADQDLVARLEQLEIGLYSRVFAQAPANSLSWLLITLESD